MKFLGRKTTKTEKTSAPKTSKAKSTKASARRSPTHEEIAARSYELYLARGREEGHAEEDWLQAERDLSGS
jgi:hypothetical protein